MYRYVKYLGNVAGFSGIYEGAVRSPFIARFDGKDLQNHTLIYPALHDAFRINEPFESNESRGNYF